MVFKRQFTNMFYIVPSGYVGLEVSGCEYTATPYDILYLHYWGRVQARLRLDEHKSHDSGSLQAELYCFIGVIIRLQA